jgi:tetratricopeptide (TPR) repeat protein
MSEAAAHIRRVAKEFLDHPLNEERLRRYHTSAVAIGKPAEALAVFEVLIGHHPQNQTLRTLYIASCLETGDHGRAMPHIEHLLAAAEPADDLLDAALTVRRNLDAQARPETAGLNLSLCMIVRDEAARLGACLNAIKPLADEIVIVDTGSADRSMDIGRAFGARVAAFEWCKDFAAARNATLDMARGRWVLVLDADEIIAERDFDRLRKLMAKHDDGRTAFSVETRNYCHAANLVGWHANDGCYASHEAGIGWFGSIKARLFPQRNDIRFHFPVHERVEPALKQAGVKTLACNVPVHHYGHLDQNLNRRKALAYYELGYAKLDKMSGDLPALRELAVQAGQLERWTEALELWQRMLELKPDFVEAHVNIAGACWQMGAYDQALSASRKAVRLDPHLKEARFNEAISLLMLGRAGQTVDILQKLIKVHRDYLPGLFMLAAACRIVGKNREAWELFDGLRKKMSAPALEIASKELAERFIGAGCGAAAEKLLHT